MELFSTSIAADLCGESAFEKCQLLNTIWPHLDLKAESFLEEDYTDFLQFIGRTLQALHQYEFRFADKTISDLRTTINEVRTHQNLTKSLILDEIKKRHDTLIDEEIGRTAELAARIWLGITISSRGLFVGPRNPRETYVQWKPEQTLSSVITEEFRQEPAILTEDEPTFDTSFKAVNLQRITRINIRWTDNLADHLRLQGRRGHRTLSIYRHKICLVNHLADPDQNVFNPGLLEESIRTLELLLPWGDPRTDSFLQEQGMRSNDIPPQFPLANDISEFRYWKRQLVLLLKIYNGPPESIVQVLTDKRNPAQFYRLWGSLFGAFFLTILFGTLATVYSIKQYNIAAKAFDLDLALACLESPAPSGLC